MQGEHYIRGLSDNELGKLVSVYRDMYTEAELKVADEEMARRRRERAPKAAAQAPAASKPSDAAAVPAAKPETSGASETRPPAASRPLPKTNSYYSRENILRRKTSTKPDRSVVGRDWSMPPPEGSESDAAKTYTGYGKAYKTKIKPNRSIVGRDWHMLAPDEQARPEAPQAAGGAFIHCTTCGNLCRKDEEYCPNCGQKPY